jgi:hypothetical protein
MSGFGGPGGRFAWLVGGSAGHGEVSRFGGTRFSPSLWRGRARAAVRSLEKPGFAPKLVDIIGAPLILDVRTVSANSCTIETSDYSSSVTFKYASLMNID